MSSLYSWDWKARHFSLPSCFIKAKKWSLITLLGGAYIKGLSKLVFCVQNIERRITQQHSYLVCCLCAKTSWQERCYFCFSQLTGFFFYSIDWDAFHLAGGSCCSPGLSLVSPSQPGLTDHLVACMLLLLSQKVKEEIKNRSRDGRERKGAERGGDIWRQEGNHRKLVYGCVYVPNKMQYYCGYVLKRNIFKTGV